MKFEIQNFSNEDLRKLQLTQLDMLIEVDRICKLHNIKYCIIAGTLLGAVRHKGYIPWDDDADVAMLREDYEKFRAACEKDLDQNKFYFQDHVVTEGYRWGFGRVRRENTEFVRYGQEHMPYKSGVFIDVFPLDGVPDNRILRGIHNFIGFTIRKTLWSEVGRKTDKSGMMRGIYSILSKIPRKAVFSIYDKFVRLSNFKETELVRILTFPTPKGRPYGYKRCWYAELKDIVFEGYTFPGAKDADGYLTYKFGNYMQLPPVEARRGHHPVSKYKLLD